MSEIKPQEILSELLSRRKALENMVAFREYMAPTHSKDFVNEPARHHKVIIRELERLESGEINRLMILAPPASAKSTYCSIQYPLLRLAKRSNRNILCASNTQDLAEDFNRRRLNVALSPQWMTLSGTKLKEDLQKVGHFGVEKGGEIRAAGIGSSITGWRSHLNVLDDPITGVEQSLSPKQLDLQWEWFIREFRTRLEPGCPELVVSTRWGKNDIAGRLLSRAEGGEEDWTVLRLPLVADSPDDPLGRELGEVLWPEFYTPKFVQEVMRNELLFKTQYQQRPLDETGSWVDAHHLIFEEPPNAGFGDGHFKFVIAMDLAYTVGRGDFTVFVVAAIDCFRTVHIMHVDRARVDVSDSVSRLLQLCGEYERYGGISEVLVDDDNGSKMFKTVLHERFRHGEFSTIPPLKVMPMRGHDKEVRATAIRSAFHEGRVKIVKAPNAAWNRDLVRECLDFPSGATDDIVDALGLIGRRLPAISAPPIPLHLTEPPQGALVEQDGVLKLNIPLNDLFEDRDAMMRNRRQRV